MSVLPKPLDDLTREERLRFLRQVHDKVDEQVRYSNWKASYILTTVGAAFVGCGAALLGPQIEGLWAKVFLVAGLVLCGLSGAASAMAIFPVMKRRKGDEPPSSLMFFGSIARMTTDEYLENVGQLTEERIVDELTQQIHALSVLAQEKYRWIRLSTMTLAVGLVLLFGAFIGIFLR